jgi:putative ABC transport system permease protein
MTAVLMIARAELRRAWRSFVVLGVLAGITGGVALAAVQVARRTSTAQARLEQAVAVPDAAVIDAEGDGSVIAELPGVSATWTAKQGVAQVENERLIYTGVLAATEPAPPGLFRPLVRAGRPPDPSAVDEVVVSQNFEEFTGFGVGATLDLAFLTRDEVHQFDVGFGAPDGPKVTVTIVGVVLTAIDSGTNTPEMFGTPALAELITPESVAATTVLVRLDDGVAGVPAFEQAVGALPTMETPAPGEQEFPAYQVVVPSRQRPVIAVTARVLVAGLFAFAGIAALAGFLGTALALRRQVLALTADPATIRAVGVVRSQARLARMFSMVPFVATGTVVGIGVALAFSGVNPIGTSGRREPHPGWHPNLALLAAGVLMLIVVLGLTVVIASRRRPRQRRYHRNGIVARATAGAPPVVDVGARFALESGGGRSALPVRSALAGTVVAIAGLVAVTVFATALARTVGTPARWGWVAQAQVVDIKEPDLARLQADPRIAAVTTIDESQVEVSGVTTNAMAFTPVRGLLGWSVLAGRMPERTGEVMLGARLSDDLDSGIGRIVTFAKDGRKLQFRVVGIGTGPNTNNNQFASDVVVIPEDLPAVRQTEPFSAAAITIAPGNDARAVLDEYGRALELGEPARPPDVDNVAQLGALPELLIGFLALVAIAVLAHLLTTAARRRRHELDVLAALGFVPRQVRGVIFVAALTMVGVGLVLGVPLGLLAGRWGWKLTADSIYVPSALESPVIVALVIAASALVVAVIVAAWPASRIGRASVAAGLRDE